MTRALKAWGPAALWAAALFLLSEVSTVPTDGRFPLDDKVAHFLLYAVLGATLAWGRRGAGAGVPHWVLLAIGWSYGAVDEWHQSFVPRRTPDPADFLADVIGVAVGYAVLHLVVRRFADDEPSASADAAKPNTDRRRRGR